MNLNNLSLNKRIDKLSSKIKDEHNEYIAPFDPTYYTEAEKQLFLKIEELRQTYGQPLPDNIMKANKDLVCKASEIMLKYTAGTFRFALLSFLGNPDNDIDKFYFNIHFEQFLKDLKSHLKKIHQYPEYQHGDILKFLDRLDVEKGAVPDKKTEYSEDDDNEHYDPEFYRV